MKLRHLLPALLIAATALRASDFALRDGDTVTFLGDSITAARGYTKIVEHYTLMRFPERRVRFINAGQGGDTAHGSLSAALRDKATLTIGKNCRRESTQWTLVISDVNFPVPLAYGPVACLRGKPVPRRGRTCIAIARHGWRLGPEIELSKNKPRKLGFGVADFVTSLS
jgi:hypothetical protein